MRSVGGDVLPGAFRDLCLELRVAEVRDVDPRVAHLVDGPVAPADPLIGIGVRSVAGRVVVPRDEVEIV